MSSRPGIAVQGLPTFGGTILNIEDALFKVKLENFISSYESDVPVYLEYQEAVGGLIDMGEPTVVIKTRNGGSYTDLTQIHAENGSIHISGTYFVG